MEKLKLFLCVFEGFKKQEYLYLVDSVVRKLGKEEASVASRNRQPVLTLKHFISQHFVHQFHRESHLEVSIKQLKPMSLNLLISVRSIE